MKNEKAEEVIKRLQEENRTYRTQITGDEENKSNGFYILMIIALLIVIFCILIFSTFLVYNTTDVSSTGKCQGYFWAYGTCHDSWNAHLVDDYYCRGCKP